MDSRLVRLLVALCRPENVIPQYDLPDVPNVGKYVIRGIDANNFAPRLGFAYSVSIQVD